MRFQRALRKNRKIARQKKDFRVDIRYLFMSVKHSRFRWKNIYHKKKASEREREKFMFTFEMNQHSPSICQRSRIAREAKIIFNEHVSPVNVCARSGGPFAVCLPSFEKETNLNSDNP